MQKTKNDIALVWFRNDLRTNDQESLAKAINNHKQIIACYCFDPRHFEVGPFGFKKTERYRAKFLIETLRDLKSNLQDLGIPLFVFNQKTEIAISNLIIEYGIYNVYFQKEWTPEESSIVQKIKSAVDSSIKFHSYYDQFLYHPHDIEINFKTIPKVFTDFRKFVEKNAKIRPVIKTQKNGANIDISNTTKIPSLKELGLNNFKMDANTAFPFKGGESHALQRLHQYIFKSKNISKYKQTRNGLIGINYSSKFSPWLANGSLSPRTIYWAIKEFEENQVKNESTYWLIFELIWRDFFKYISLKHGNAIFKLGGILNKDYEWNTDPLLINSWIDGKTSEDFVNANMLEFKKTGWMSNRGRQNVASYFAKELHLDWRIGASYFESLLVDYDVHSNYGNWMYVAGVGNDPRDRKFNIKRQAEHYDSESHYRKLWL